MHAHFLSMFYPEQKAHEKFATDQEKVLGFSITTSFRGLWGGALVAALAAIINVIVAD